MGKTNGIKGIILNNMSPLLVSLDVLLVFRLDEPFNLEIMQAV